MVISEHCRRKVKVDGRREGGPEEDGGHRLEDTCTQKGRLEDGREGGQGPTRSVEPWSSSIRQKMGAQNIVMEIKRYQKKWLQHVQRMDTNRLPKQALQYKPKRRRNIGRPRKRWRDQLHLEDQ